MSGVVIHVAAAGGGAAVTLELGPGAVARFGRGAPDHPVELLLGDRSVPRLAGEIRACDDHWQLSNFSSTQSYVVENPEGAGEYFRVAPRRIGAPVPFEFARVVLPSQGAPQSFQVFAPAHMYYDAMPLPATPATATLMAFPLDESSTYFQVLVALCEPRLRDVSVSAVPTTRQVGERLRARPGLQEITEAGVNFHIDYLARNKLRVRQPAADGQRMDGKREAVVSLALRFGLVREEHLSLLPPRPTAISVVAS
ncbi:MULTISPECIES: serine/threonine protein kinase [unclassified Streptomyces]|uniref:serine/threonine protein kinase n=1 Tax=unclassified Streptomyces TaxID=2593676 RepID=UPI001BE9C27F|nr:MULTISPECIES: serine/threonine protein kinase [unclassified Streptomyces]MBT2406573.1 serine/threonine protein kinase [Streptomyces sp. ISL-21]MBT2458041.1 serine/threonine protein kinase [Streptomyces sp. ISL-86]MBT2608911.1 serine/threonine protein kinase [Streptomyces sp. ISL-87]